VKTTADNQPIGKVFANDGPVNCRQIHADNAKSLIFPRDAEDKARAVRMAEAQDLNGGLALQTTPGGATVRRATALSLYSGSLRCRVSQRMMARLTHSDRKARTIACRVPPATVPPAIQEVAEVLPSGEACIAVRPRVWSALPESNRLWAEAEGAN
jgi:hypothetical protein